MDTCGRVFNIRGLCGPTSPSHSMEAMEAALWQQGRDGQEHVAPHISADHKCRTQLTFSFLLFFSTQGCNPQAGPFKKIIYLCTYLFVCLFSWHGGL